ncbi:Peroxidase 12 [Glycine max]|nr:Peroxidase 12 [Glycine max]
MDSGDKIRFSDKSWSPFARYSNIKIAKKDMATPPNSFCSLFFIYSILLSSFFLAYEAQAYPPVVNGLSYSLYSQTCPKLESIVRNHLEKEFTQASWQAAALLVVFFHDCFVQGCDGSLLLDGNPGERDHPLNRGISLKVLRTIDDLRNVVHNECGRIVSCADITVLAARDAVYLSGGPNFAVPLGRRDSLNFSFEEVNNLPLPYNITSVTLQTFASKNLDVTNVVALVGAHTLGRAHCHTFYNRLSPLDPNMDKTLAKILNTTCPSTYSRNTANLDIRTPKVFDNKYYINLMNRQGLFTSDQDLFTDKRTKGLVEAFAHDQTLFFEKFVDGFIRMSQLDVLTGNQGEIRAKCNVINNKRPIVTSINVDEMPPVVKGLSYSFYSKTCPKLESIVRKHLKKVFKDDNGQAPALLRIFFHDCFVQGCDGSLLLDGSPSERDQPANGGIRTEALQTIDDIRAIIHKECGRIVSCADITVLAARDSVFLTGGPDYAVPLGRRDGLSFSTSGTSDLPKPFNTTGVTLDAFAAKNFDVTDVVALSGAHTFGRAHCGTFFNRLSPLDPNMDKTLAKQLQSTCPDANSGNTANLDIRTPTVFDNKYYLDLMNRQGVFTSDQDLLNDKRTKGLVNAFALNQTLFFEKFVDATIKLSQLDVLTGNQGEIRGKCNVVNARKSLLTSVVEEVVQLVDQF